LIESGSIVLLNMRERTERHGIGGRCSGGIAVEEVLLAPILDLMAFEGALSAAEDGVYATAVVVAFEPADDDPEDAKDEEAPGPSLPRRYWSEYTDPEVCRGFVGNSDQSPRIT
jgi:hypothetical protein